MDKPIKVVGFIIYHLRNWSVAYNPIGTALLYPNGTIVYSTPSNSTFIYQQFRTCNNNNNNNVGLYEDQMDII